MNLIETFQDLVAQVPNLVQPLIVALAGAIPFVEGEGAAAIGIIAGVPPIVAAIAAAVGNFVCVAVLVLLSSRARHAVVTRRARTRESVLVGADGADTAAASPSMGVDGEARNSARRAKFQRAFERYGVPGVSLLGPTLLPTHFTATMLAAAGVGRARILIWQAIAIIGWTTIIALIISGAVYAIP